MNETQHPPKLDIKQSAQASLHFEGLDKLSNYERLMQEAQGPSAENALHWSALTEWRADAVGHAVPWLHLTVKTSLPQICQRCLGPVDVQVQIARDFRFVESESAAEQQDDESEEDVLVISRAFDLAVLIEDEVLMDLPLIARHEVCPVAVKLAAVDADFDSPAEKPNPFAVLAQLKGTQAG